MSVLAGRTLVARAVLESVVDLRAPGSWRWPPGCGRGWRPWDVVVSYLVVAWALSRGTEQVTSGFGRGAVNISSNGFAGLGGGSAGITGGAVELQLLRALCGQSRGDNAATYAHALIYTLKRKSTTSPSAITYSLPSIRTFPAALA